jgi:hypothetical protein
MLAHFIRLTCVCCHLAAAACRCTESASPDATEHLSFSHFSSTPASLAWHPHAPQLATSLPAQHDCVPLSCMHAQPEVHGLTSASWRALQLKHSKKAVGPAEPAAPNTAHARASRFLRRVAVNSDLPKVRPAHSADPHRLHTYTPTTTRG